jgi:single-strand DNA-binding protein
MAGYQYTIIVGNVGRDPEMRYTQTGVAVASFSVAVSESWTDKNANERKEKTTWFKVSAWRGLAEVVSQHVRKGMQVMVTGEVKASAYMGKDGEPQASLELTAKDFKFLGRKSDNASEAAGDNDAAYDQFEPEDLPF